MCCMTALMRWIKSTQCVELALCVRSTYFMATFILCDMFYSLKFSSLLCCQSLFVHINLPQLCECDSHLTLICPIRKTLWKVK